MEMKRTNAYRHLKVPYIINKVSLLHVHVLATLVAILREVYYMGYIAETSRTNANAK
jgi:hypothetical protein